MFSLLKPTFSLLQCSHILPTVLHPHAERSPTDTQVACGFAEGEPKGEAYPTASADHLVPMHFRREPALTSELLRTL